MILFRFITLLGLDSGTHDCSAYRTAEHLSKTPVKGRSGWAVVEIPKMTVFHAGICSNGTSMSYLRILNPQQRNMTRGTPRNRTWTTLGTPRVTTRPSKQFNRYTSTTIKSDEMPCESEIFKNMSSTGGLVLVGGCRRLKNECT